MVRAAGLAAALAAAVVLCAPPAGETGPVRVAASPRPRPPAHAYDTLGRYRFCPIQGWKREATPGAPVSTITYTRTVARAQVQVRYTFLTTPPGTAPASTARLQRDLAATTRALRESARTDHARVRHLRSYVMRFQRCPAAVTLVRTTTGSDANDTRMLRFLAGGAEYWISVNVRGPARAAPAFRTAAVLWAKCRREARPL